ncbi:leucyl aminopeptidase family protein [uncultured Sphingosinicella sp.]|uniref:M17 family metallopeptidase n=1 Tax=uncultured Sphingosinicella sp. TaxID=478748 RepID=UPI0030D6D666|tara:strand:+ start:13140 stop:14606 length:1467 start_codon:yes stop_codon:yes gene_type:complete
MTSWTSVNIEAGRAQAPLLVLASARRVRAPAAIAERVSATLRAVGFAAQPGCWLDLIGQEDISARIVVVAVADDTAKGRWRETGGHIVAALRALGLPAARLPAATDLDIGEHFTSLIEGVLLHGFSPDRGRNTRHFEDRDHLLLVAAEDLVLVEHARQRADPVNRARAWVNQPANLLTPAVFADEAEAALTPLGITVHQLGPEALSEIGARGLLAVASGSDNPPRLTLAEWRGTPDRPEWDVALVGKGLTFDAGGLNLKVPPVINMMKLDMAGGAAVLGAIERLARRKAAMNVVAVVPMAENLIDGKGYRPGDVITSLAGLTIEVLDTDAEGRIVLADGIAYAISRYLPATVIDVATLTGAVTSVLHEDFAGLFTADDALADELIRAGGETGEAVWRLPLVPAQDYLVESIAADVANLGTPGLFGLGARGPVAGAKFIEKFTAGCRWAHLDIAGTAWATRPSSRSGPGPTGFGVALLDRWIDMAGKTA